MQLIIQSYIYNNAISTDITSPKFSVAQDSSAYEDDGASSPIPRKRRSSDSLSDSEDRHKSRSRVNDSNSNNKSGSEASSFESSSDDDDDDEEPDYQPKKSSRRQDESTYDSFEEVNGSDSSQVPSNKAPRTSRTEFRNVDAELYDLRRSGRSRRAPKIIDDDDDEDEDEEVPFMHITCLIETHQTCALNSFHQTYIVLFLLSYTLRVILKTTTTTDRTLVLGLVMGQTTAVVITDMAAKRRPRERPQSLQDLQGGKVIPRTVFPINLACTTSTKLRRWQQTEADLIISHFSGDRT